MEDSYSKLLEILEKVRSSHREVRKKSNKTLKLQELGYKSIICLCNDGVARAVNPGESIPGTNVVPIPRKE